MPSAGTPFRNRAPDRTAWPSADVLSRLVSAAQAADGQVDALLAVLRPALLSYFARSMSRDVAEDLTQTALVRIHRALPQIEAERADAFIWTVTRNLRRNAEAMRARETRRRAPEHLAHAVGVSPAADRDTEYEELTKAVHRVALAKLSPGGRDVVLGLLRGESRAEITARLGISSETLRIRLMRARAVLRGELAGYLDAPDDEE